EHLALLRCLAKHHGLHRVFAEGLTAQEVTAYREKVADLKGAEADLKKQLEEVVKLLEDAPPGSQRQTKAKEVQAEILAALGQHRLDVLRLGVAGQLLLSEEIEEVLPLDDAELLEKAKPITPDGKVKAEKDRFTARHDGQVTRVLARGPFAL